MKKWFLAVIAILAFFFIPAVADAAEHSSDTMILDWSTNKVWLDKAIYACGVLFITNAVI